jgi:hypothetical protein
MKKKQKKKYQKTKEKEKHFTKDKICFKKQIISKM